VAVASAGLYASLHLAADRKPRQHPITQFLQADALPATQPHQSTEGKWQWNILFYIYFNEMENQ